MRWVCPTIIASTVVSWSCVGDRQDRALPRHARRVADRVLAALRPLVDDDDLDLDARAARSRSDSALIRGASSGTSARRSLPAETSSGVFLSSAPMTPTLTPLTVKTADGVTHGGALPGRRLDDVRREEREVRPRLLLRAAARRRSRTRGCRSDVASRPQAFSTSIAGMSSSSAEFGGEAPTLSPRGEEQARRRAGPRAPRRTSSRGTARRRPCCVDARRTRACVGSSWPWKSFSPTIEIGL